MKQKFKTREALITMAVALIIIFGIGALLFYRQSTVNNQNTQTPEPETAIILALDDKNNIKLENKTIKLPSDWQIQLSIRSTKGTNLICEDTNSDLCTINYVSKGSFRFLLTIPSTVKPKEVRAFSSENKKLNYLGKEVEFKYEMYSVEKRSDTNENGQSEQSSEKIYSLISGCNEGVCLSSELLSEDLETNKKQVAAFEELAKGLKVE